MASSDSFISATAPGATLEARGGAGALEATAPAFELTSDSGAELQSAGPAFSFSADVVTSPLTHVEPLTAPGATISITAPGFGELLVKSPGASIYTDTGADLRFARSPGATISGTILGPRIGSVVATAPAQTGEATADGTLKLPAKAPAFSISAYGEPVEYRSGSIDSKAPAATAVLLDLSAQGWIEASAPAFSISGLGTWEGGAPGSMSVSAPGAKFYGRGDSLYEQVSDLGVKAPGPEGSGFGAPSTEGNLTASAPGSRGLIYGSKISYTSEVETEVSPIYPDDDEVIRWT